MQKKKKNYICHLSGFFGIISHFLSIFVILCYFQSFTIIFRNIGYYKETKTNLDDKTKLVSMDFAEHLKLDIQGSIQSFYFQMPQVAIITIVIRFVFNGVKELKSFMFASVNLDDRTVFVYSVQKKLTKYKRKYFPSVQKVIYFTDGAASHFKNRKTFTNLIYHHTEFGLTSE